MVPENPNDGKVEEVVSFYDRIRFYYNYLPVLMTSDQIIKAKYKIDKNYGILVEYKISLSKR